MKAPAIKNRRRSLQTDLWRLIFPQPDLLLFHRKYDGFAEK